MVATSTTSTPTSFAEVCKLQAGFLSLPDQLKGEKLLLGKNVLDIIGIVKHIRLVYNHLQEHFFFIKGSKPPSLVYPWSRFAPEKLPFLVLGLFCGLLALVVLCNHQNKFGLFYLPIVILGLAQVYQHKLFGTRYSRKMRLVINFRRMLLAGHFQPIANEE